MTLTNFLKTQDTCFNICIIQVKGLERSNRQGKFRKFFFFARDINQNTVPKKHLVPGKGPNLLMDNWILLGFWVAGLRILICKGNKRVGQATSPFKLKKTVTTE